MPEEQYFALFVSELILRRYQPGIPAVLDGLVDGVGDCGVDSFYCFINDQLLTTGIDYTRLGGDPRVELHIIQAKREAKFSEDPLQRLQIHLPELLDMDRHEPALAPRVNPRLLDASRMFLEALTAMAPLNPRLSIDIHYVSRGESAHPNTQAKARMLEGCIRALISHTQVSVHFYGPSDLLTLARRQESITKELKIADGPLSSDSERGQGYICLVDLEDLYGLICEPDTDRLHSAIFEANVRDRYPDSNVNRAIYQTLENHGSPDFWWLNNGITILSPNARQHGKRLKLDNPQIVNGLQTSNEIYEYFRNGGSSRGRLVLVRVISATDDTVRDEIVRATNNQNLLPEGLLRATHRFQFGLEEYLERRGFFYDRRKHYHINRKTQPDKVISMEFMAQCMTACLLREPWRARRDVALLLEDKHYPRIFSDSITHDAYLSSLLITRRVKRTLEASRVFVNAGHFVDDYVFHVATAATILLTRRTSPNAHDLAGANASLLNDEAIMDLVPIVAESFKRFLGKTDVRPESSASEDQETSEAILKRFARILSDPRSKAWPDQRLQSDYRNFGSDVVYSNARRPRRR